MSMLSPLDNIRPSDLLSQYSEWIYFTLILIFFISVAGLTLRKHFDRPYVKPLIIAVGLMMTVGVFMMRDKLVAIFEGWGILGTLLLVFVAATIPYGLCRGFGMPTNKAFYVVYILFYVLSWAKFPDAYYYLGDHNMGLVNLGLLILFVYCIYKIVPTRRSRTDLSGSLQLDSPIRKEIGKEIEAQDVERGTMEQEKNKVVAFEIKTIADIEESLVELMRTIEAHNDNLSTQDRMKIATTLKKISRKEDLFLKSLRNLKQLLPRLHTLNQQQLQEMKNRLEHATGKDKDALQQEIAMEQEKLRLEGEIMAIGEKIEQGMAAFTNLIRQAIQVLNNSTHPSDANPHLAEARLVLKDMMGWIEKIRTYEDSVVQLTKTEKSLLNKEKEAK
jgi:hypothetical protein